MISSIPTEDPEDMRRNVADHRERGYRGHSIKIGALDSEGGPALDAERIAACLADKRPPAVPGPEGRSKATQSSPSS